MDVPDVIPLVKGMSECLAGIPLRDARGNAGPAAAPAKVHVIRLTGVTISAGNAAAVDPKIISYAWEKALRSARLLKCVRRLGGWLGRAGSGLLRDGARGAPPAQLAKRYEPSLLLVPHRKRRASQALEKSETPEARQLRIVAQNL
jgi:hypothetical protein